MWMKMLECAENGADGEARDWDEWKGFLEKCKTQR